MLRRQFLLRGPRLDRLPISPLTTALRIDGPPLKAGRPAEVGRRRWLASLSSSTFTFTQQRGNWLPDETPTSNLTLLDRLLRAIQLREIGHVFPAFHEWVASLVDDDHNVSSAALQELGQLPISTFSEILRWLDPVENPQLDVAYGMNITLGQVQFTNARHLVNEFGVRHQHRYVLDAMKVLLHARIGTGRQLMICDYEVLLRCAGAASNLNAAMEFSGAMTKNGVAQHRTTRTWNEFIKARYHIEPVYHQFDRQRIHYTGRMSYKANQPIPIHNIWRMEGLRYSMNALQAEPFGRHPDFPWKELVLQMRKKKGYRSYLEHWRRSKGFGILVDEELLCSTLIGLARSGSFKHMRGVVIFRGFRIRLLENKDTGEVTVSGGKRFRSGNPREPTKRILNAIVEAFGSISHITSALKLLIYFSRFYKIPIPREAWSNLLNWSYTCASKSNQFQHRMIGNYPSGRSSPVHFLNIWNTMTSQRFNVKPIFADYVLYAKTLMVSRNFRTAEDIIRDHLVPYYRHLEDQHQQIVLNEILQEVPEFSHRRLQIETQKEHVWYQIAECFDQFFSIGSKGKWQRQNGFTKVVIPNIVAEFGEFLHDQVRYRTSQGHVHLKLPVQTPRFHWTRQMRTTLPQARGGMEIRMMEMRGRLETAHSFEEREQDWPHVPQMDVVEQKRKPIPRFRPMGPAPESTDVNAREWWKRLEEDLMR
ncbi:hypothetical protein FSARC_12172 [Fusarium sarcochroum]|uniref:Mitochondrial ATPase expression-domain-containing protein n=1 Tax=Fusarium sarcochroum TaxID=1208366 RepID=A0A8H4TAF6_9HYPO|nr:hypothetical protein FSARC_12172 [Fusarium sarcochroum]